MNYICQPIAGLLFINQLFSGRVSTLIISSPGRRMKKIPIQFDYKGKHYEGYFSEIFGVGTNTWHLMIDNFYKGQLLHTNNGWAFHRYTIKICFIAKHA
jgi:hypothetical protein